MNIEKLIAAAQEIDRKSLLQEQRSKQLQQIALLVRKASDADDKNEVRRLQDEYRNMSITVVDFGGCINELRRALKARPAIKRDKAARK